MATKEQMQEEFIYFSEVWNFFKAFYEVKENDSYWDTVVHQAGEIIKRHDSPLCKAITLAVIDELDRKGRERSKNNE